jgi:hypothetical protein
MFPIVPSRFFPLLSCIVGAPGGSFISQIATLIHAADADAAPTAELTTKSAAISNAERRSVEKHCRKEITPNS